MVPKTPRASDFFWGGGGKGFSLALLEDGSWVLQEPVVCPPEAHLFASSSELCLPFSEDIFFVCFAACSARKRLATGNSRGVAEGL